MPSQASEGFHGLVAFDVNSDGIADFSTWIGVGPDGEVPLVAQQRAGVPGPDQPLPLFHRVPG